MKRLKLLTLMMMLIGHFALADTITIGKGSGIVWEGMPFSISLQVGIADTPNLYFYRSVGFIVPTSTQSLSCVEDSSLTTIAGYKVFQLGPGIGIMPRATISADYVLADGTTETLNGTIGLPSTQATTSSNISITNPINGLNWCITPRMSSSTNFYKTNTYINSKVSGTWVIVTDGTQLSQNFFSINNMNFMMAGGGSYTNFRPILPSALTIRTSTLECTVNTPTQINFGAVANNLQSGAELGLQTNSLIANCSQDSSRGVDANINVQFRAITGLYGSTAARLALRQGGGYITGEINNGVTGSGNCNTTTGLPFDNTPLKVGNITSTQASQSTANQVTWRLCSGGSSLPTGSVDAAAEMLVTFN